MAEEKRGEQRKFDVVVFGATSFVGKLVCDYMAREVKLSQVKWAIAGKNKDSLLKLKAYLSFKYGDAQPELRDLPIISANIEQYNSVVEMAKNTRVLLNLVGPYTTMGEPVLKACVVNARTHYLDLCGEVNFIEQMRHKYEALAQESSVCVMHAAGFESVASDLGTLLALTVAREKQQKHLQDEREKQRREERRASSQTITVHGGWRIDTAMRIDTVFSYLELHGGQRPSTGTLRSVLLMIRYFSLLRDYPNMVTALYGIENLNIITATIVLFTHFVLSLFGYSLKLYPHFSMALKRFVVFMPGVDNIIVRRTARLLPDLYYYHAPGARSMNQPASQASEPSAALDADRRIPVAHFFFAEYMIVSWFGFLMAWAMIPLLPFIFCVLKIGFINDLLIRLLPKQEAPSREKREAHFFQAKFHAHSMVNPHPVVVSMGGRDPGYDEASKMAAEAAVVMAEALRQTGSSARSSSGGVHLAPMHKAVLQRGGWVTPAAALGDALIERLRQRLVRIDVIAN